jgi:hypothetical protein
MTSLLKKLISLLDVDWKDTTPQECKFILRMHRHALNGEAVGGEDYSKFNELYLKIIGKDGLTLTHKT